MILLALVAFGLDPSARAPGTPVGDGRQPGPNPELSSLLEETRQLMDELREASKPQLKTEHRGDAPPSSFMETLLQRASAAMGSHEERELEEVISSCKAYDFDCEQDGTLRGIAIRMDQHARYVQDLTARNAVIDYRTQAAKATVKDVGARLQEARDEAEDEFYQLTRQLLEKIKVYKGSIAGIAEKNRAALEKAESIYNTLLAFQQEQLGQMQEYLLKAEDDLTAKRADHSKIIKARVKAIEDTLRKNVDKGTISVTEAGTAAAADVDAKRQKVLAFEKKSRKKMKKDQKKMVKDAAATGEEATTAGDAMDTLESDLATFSEDSLKNMDKKINAIDKTAAANELKIDEADTEFFGQGGRLEEAYKRVEDQAAAAVAEQVDKEGALEDTIMRAPNPPDNVNDGGILPKFKNNFNAELYGKNEEPGVMLGFDNKKSELRTQLAAKLTTTSANAIENEAFADKIMKDYSAATKALVVNRTKFATKAGETREGYQNDVDTMWKTMKDKVDPILDGLDAQNGMIKADQLEERAAALPRVTQNKKDAESALKAESTKVDDTAHEVQTSFKDFYAWEGSEMNKLNSAEFESTQLANQAQANFNNAKIATTQVAQANQNSLKRYKETAVSEKLRQKGAGEKFAHGWIKDEKSQLGFADQQASQDLTKYKNNAKQVTAKFETTSQAMIKVLKDMASQHNENLRTRDAVVELASGPLKDLRQNADLYHAAVQNTDADFVQNLANLKSAFNTELSAEKDVYVKGVKDALRSDAKGRKDNMTAWVGSTGQLIGQQAADLTSTEDGIVKAVEGEEAKLEVVDSDKKKAAGKEEATDKSLSKEINKLRDELSAEKVGSIEDLQSIKEGMQRREAAIEKLAGKSFTKLKAEQKKAFGQAKIKRKQTITNLKAGTDQAFEDKQTQLDNVDQQMQQVVNGLGRQARLAEQAVAEAEGTVKKDGQNAADAAAKAHEIVSSTDLVNTKSREEREALLDKRSKAMKQLILDETGSTDKAFAERLDHLTAGAESKLRAILADETMSDAEKKRAIEEYDKLTQAAVAALVSEQKQAEANIMNLERTTMSWGAEIDADLEAAEGILSEEKMRWVNVQLHAKEDEKTKLHQVGGLISEMLDTLDAQSDLDPEVLAAIRAHQRKAFGSMQAKLTEIEAEQEAAKREMALLLRLSQADAIPLSAEELQELQTQLGAIVEEVGDLDGSLWRRLESEKESRGKASEAEKAFMVYSTHTALGHLVDTADILSTVSRVTREKEDALLAKVNELRAHIHEKVGEALADQNWGMKGLSLQMHGIDQKALATLSRDELSAAQNKAVQERERKDAEQAELDAQNALLAGEDAAQKLAAQVGANIDSVIGQVGLDAQRTALQSSGTVNGVLSKNTEWVEGVEKHAHDSALTLEQEFAAIAKRSAERSAKLDDDDNLLMEGVEKLNEKVERQEKKIANLHYAVNMAEHSRQVDADAKARAAQRALASVSGRAQGSLAESSPRPSAQKLEEQLLAEQQEATRKIEAENAKVQKYLEDHNLM